MMEQLSAAEQELARKKAEADQDMMMAGMVRAIISSKTTPVHSSKTSLCVCSTVYCPTGVRQREGSGGQRPQGQERRQDCPEHHHRPAGSAG